jgi:hypothetical protein
MSFIYIIVEFLASFYTFLLAKLEIGQFQFCYNNFIAHMHRYLIGKRCMRISADVSRRVSVGV